MPDKPKRQDLKARAFRFAESVLKLYPRLAAGGPARAHMAQQLFRAVSSIGAQLEEGEVRLDPLLAQDLAPLIQESREFIAMLTVSVRKLRTPHD